MKKTNYINDINEINHKNIYNDIFLCLENTQNLLMETNIYMKFIFLINMDNQLYYV